MLLGENAGISLAWSATFMPPILCCKRQAISVVGGSCTVPQIVSMFCRSSTQVITCDWRLKRHFECNEVSIKDSVRLPQSGLSFPPKPAWQGFEVSRLAVQSINPIQILLLAFFIAYPLNRLSNTLCYSLLFGYIQNNAFLSPAKSTINAVRALEPERIIGMPHALPLPLYPPLCACPIQTASGVPGTLVMYQQVR